MSDMGFVVCLVSSLTAFIAGGVCFAAIEVTKERRAYARGKADGYTEATLGIQQVTAKDVRALRNQRLSSAYMMRVK